MLQSLRKLKSVMELVKPLSENADGPGSNEIEEA